MIAGGSILSSLLVQPPLKNGSDIDLFFLKENPRLFERAVVRLKIILVLFNQMLKIIITVISRKLF